MYLCWYGQLKEIMKEFKVINLIQQQLSDLTTITTLESEAS